MKVGMIYIFLISLMCVVFEVIGYRETITVPKVNGKCEINGKLFKRGEKYMSKQKCEVWTCLKKSPRKNGKLDKKLALVNVKGCRKIWMDIDSVNDCFFKSTTGKYPDCCFGEQECGERNFAKNNDFFDIMFE